MCHPVAVVGIVLVAAVVVAVTFVVVVPAVVAVVPTPRVVSVAIAVVRGCAVVAIGAVVLAAVGVEMGGLEGLARPSHTEKSPEPVWRMHVLLAMVLHAPPEEQITTPRQFVRHLPTLAIGTHDAPEHCGSNVGCGMGVGSGVGRTACIAHTWNLSLAPSWRHR